MTTPPDLQVLLPPATDPVALLDDVLAFLRRFVAFPSDPAAIATTLWAAHTHLVQAGDNSPRLAFLSPEPSSGKTRALEVLELVTHEPMLLVDATPAPVFRSIEATQPTLLFDEVDTIFGAGKGEDPAAQLRGLLNSGHRRGATVARCSGPNQEVHHFPVFAAVAMAGLGNLPETLMARSIIVRMRRRADGENVEPFRVRIHGDEGHELGDQLAQWTENVAQTVGEAWPELPPGITDRAADVWEPLISIADAAGGHWPQLARTSCVEMCAVSANRDPSLGVQLLSDLRTLFDEEGQQTLHTVDILTYLNGLDEAPWGDLRGKPLDPRELAKLLKTYDVRPADVKIGGLVRKGYRRSDPHDPWKRYLPDPEMDATSATSATHDPGHPASGETDQPVGSARSAGSAAAEVDWDGWWDVNPMRCDKPKSA